MKIENIEIEVCEEDNSITIPFDQEHQHGMKYLFTVNPEDATDEDRVVLSLNKAGCHAFVQIFGQLALGPYRDGFHVHLGYDDSQAYGRGVRIELKE